MVGLNHMSKGEKNSDLDTISIRVSFRINFLSRGGANVTIAELRGAKTIIVCFSICEE